MSGNFLYLLCLLFIEVHILTQRALKIEHETEKHRRGRKDAEQQINDLDLSLNKMTKELHKKRGYKENLDKENMLIQTESICILKVENNSIFHLPGINLMKCANAKFLMFVGYGNRKC